MGIGKGEQSPLLRRAVTPTASAPMDHRFLQPTLSTNYNYGSSDSNSSLDSGF